MEKQEGENGKVFSEFSEYSEYSEYSELCNRSPLTIKDRPLIRQPRVSVLQQDDATIGETVLAKEGTHGAVVLVGVYADGVRE